MMFQTEVSEPNADTTTEPAAPYVVDQTGLPALGGDLSRLSNDGGVLDLVREGLPYSMLEELTVAIGGSIPSTTTSTTSRRDRSPTSATTQG